LHGAYLLKKIIPPEEDLEGDAGCSVAVRLHFHISSLTALLAMF
jgi:hypothetical protein